MSAHESGVENNGKHQSFEIHAVRLPVMLHLKRFWGAKVVGPPLSQYHHAVGGVGNVPLAVGTREHVRRTKSFFAEWITRTQTTLQQKHMPIWFVWQERKMQGAYYGKTMYVVCALFVLFHS